MQDSIEEGVSVHNHETRQVARSRWRRRSARYFSVGSIALALALVTSCSSSGGTNTGTQNTNGPSAGINLKVGFPADITGDNAFAGTEQARVARLAVKDVNSSGGPVHITLDTQDTKSDPGVVVSVMNNMLSADDAVVGIQAADKGQAAEPLVSRSDKPVIYLQSPIPPGSRPSNLFSMDGPRAPSSKAIIAMMAQKGVKSIAFLWTQQSTLVGDMSVLRAAAKAAGIKILVDKGVDVTTTDLSSEISQVKQADPDAVGLEMYPNQSGQVVSSLRQQGYKGEMFGQNGDTNEAFLKVAGKSAVNGYLVTTQWSPAVAKPGDNSSKFVSQWKAAYPGQPLPDAFGAEAWDGIHIIAAAAASAGSTDPTKMVNAIASGSFHGATQPTIKFGSDGTAELFGYILKYTSAGTLKLVKPVSSS